MGAALGGGNQVHVAFHHRVATFRQPLDGPVYGFFVTGEAAGKRFQRDRFDIRQGRAQIIPQAVLVEPLVFFAGLFLQEGHPKAWAQYGLGAQVMAQAADRKIGAVEVFWIRRELQAGTGVALANSVDHFQLGSFIAVGEGHPVQLAVTLDQHFQVGGQGIHNRDTHTVQTTGEVVVTFRELAAGVQAGQDQFDPGHALFFVNIDGHTPAVVFHAQGIVTVKHYVDSAGVAGQCLIHTVVDHFLSQVVGP